MLDQIDPAWAWAAYEPSADTPWTRKLAAHLYRRAGFGPRWEELSEAERKGPAATIDKLLALPAADDPFYGQVNGTIGALLATGNAAHLPAWWLYVMLHTPTPL